MQQTSKLQQRNNAKDARAIKLRIALATLGQHWKLLADAHHE